MATGVLGGAGSRQRQEERHARGQAEAQARTGGAPLSVPGVCESGQSISYHGAER